MKDGDSFRQQTLKQDDIKKAIVIFYSVACPYCDTLFATLAPHIGKLKQEGIKLIFINVPAGDKLQGRQPPTMDEYNQAVSKVTAGGITIDNNNTQVAVVADVATLSQLGIAGLPAMMVIKESVEQSRGVGQDAIQKVNFGDQATFSQLQAVFKDADKSEEEDADKKQKGAGKAGGKSSGKGKKATDGASMPRGVNRDLAREWTAILNSECGHSLSGTSKRPPQPIQKQEAPAPVSKPEQERKCTCDVES
jgi:thiol-disulfide isomerase/thioredoxin